LRDGVKWHDGKPFTAADVKCTYALLIGKAKEKLRLNYREAWFLNLDEITTNGDLIYERGAKSRHRRSPNSGRTNPPERLRKEGPPASFNIPDLSFQGAGGCAARRRGYRR
jgi:Bacterial extracellular solute-binding proteins, family 5 Middle